MQLAGNKTYPELHLFAQYRATLLHQLGRNEESLKVSSDALRLLETNEQRLPLLKIKGSAHNSLLQRDEASAVLKEALALARDDAEINFELGKTMVHLHLNEAAAFHFTVAARRSPSAETYYALALVHRSMKMLDEVIDELAKSLEYNPSNQQAFLDYVYALKEACEWDQVESHMPAVMQKLKRGEITVHPFLGMMLNLSSSIILQQTNIKAQASGKPRRMFVR